MRIYDISMEIREGMPVYKNKPAKSPKIIITNTIKQGSNESKLEIESHTGTHADAYYHMLAKGKKIDNIPLDKFMGECIVLDFTKVKHNKITLNDIKKENNKIKKNDIVILKTRNTKMEAFDFNFTFLDKNAAKFLSTKNIKSIGTDNLGIERLQPHHDTHRILFKKNITIIEGLELSKIKPGRYFFIGLPLKIKDGDGSPIRAVLVEGLK